MHRRSALHYPRPIDARAAPTSPVAPARPQAASATELRRPFGVECSILVPPYDALAPLPSPERGALPPPLGAIVHASAPPVLGALATLTITVRRFPWVAPCIAVTPDDEWLEPCIGLVSELGDRLAVVHARGRAPRVPASAIVEAVRRRPPPRAAAMADYVSRRLAHPELLAPLRFPTVRPPDDGYRLLATLPPGPLLELPVYSRQFGFVRESYMLNSTVHWMPLVDAYSDYIPEDFTAHMDALGGFPSLDAFRVLVSRTVSGDDCARRLGRDLPPILRKGWTCNAPFQLHMSMHA